MTYLLIFIEGFLSFISPCMLPMLPIYISYFAGNEEKNLKKTMINAIAFVLGFTIVFMILSILASTVGSVLGKTNLGIYIELLFGIIVIFFGLNYLDILKFKFMNKTKKINVDKTNLNFFKSLLFGMLFSISWTPCIGMYLASALAVISQEHNLLKGLTLIITYSFGLGIPFLISVLLMEKLKNTFNFIKKNYKIVKIISGVVLIGMGMYLIVKSILKI